MKIKDVSFKQLKKLIAESKSNREVLQKLNENPSNGNESRKLTEFIQEQKIDITHFKRKFEFDKQQMVELTGISNSIKDLGIKLDKAVPGVAMGQKLYRKIRDYLIKEEIDFSHFDSCASKGRGFNIRYANEEIFINPSYASKQTVKSRYLQTRTKGIECDACGLNQWMEKSIELALDHIDGNCVNNCLENLRLLCPNCHSQTDTFAGRNKQFLRNKKIARERQQLLLKKQQEGKLRDNFRNQEQLKTIETRKQQILISNIDFTSFGRGIELGKLMGMKPPCANRWLRKHMPEQYYQLKHVKINQTQTKGVSA